MATSHRHRSTISEIIKNLDPPKSTSTKVLIGPSSKAQRASKNCTVSKKPTHTMNTLKYLPSTTVASNKNTSISKQILAERGIKIVTVPVNKNHNVIHNNAKFGHSTKPVTSTSHQFSKGSPKVHPATSVSQNFVNRNYVSSSPHSNTSTPGVVPHTNSKSSSNRVIRPPSVSPTKLSQNSNSIPNSENKTSISNNMLDCLKKKGISVVLNVDDSKTNLNSKISSKVTSPHNSYLNSVKNALKKHNININVVPVSTDDSPSSAKTLSVGGVKETSNISNTKGTSSSVSSIKVAPSASNTKSVPCVSNAKNVLSSSNNFKCAAIIKTISPVKHSVKTSPPNNAGNSSLVNNVRNSLLVNTRNLSIVNNTRNSSVVNNTRNSSLVINTRNSSVVNNTRNSSVENNTRNLSVENNTRNSVVNNTRNSSVVNNTRNSSVVNNTRNSSLVINTRSASHVNNARNSSLVTNTRISSGVNNAKNFSASNIKNSLSSLSRTVVNSKSLSQTTLKRKFEHSDSFIQNKLVCTRKPDGSPQNIIFVKSGDASTKAGHKINVIKNASRNPNSSLGTAAIVTQCHKVNESQKSNSKIESALKTNHKKKSSTSDSMLPYSVKGALTIIPVQHSKLTTSVSEKPVKSALQFSSQQKCLPTSLAVKEYSNNNAKTASSNTAPLFNPALSVTVVNSSKSLQPGIGSSKITTTIAGNTSKLVKTSVVESSKTTCVREKPVKGQSQHEKTSNKPSLPSLTKTKSLHTTLLSENKKLTSAISLQLPKKVSKSIDLSKDRDRLLSILLSAGSKSSNNEPVKIPNSIQIRTVSGNKSISYDEPIKLIDVPNKIRSWPKPIVLLHRIDIPKNYLMAKEVFSTKSTGGFFVKKSIKKVALQATTRDPFVALDKIEKDVDHLQKTVREFVMKGATDKMVTSEKVQSFAIKDKTKAEISSQTSQSKFVTEDNEAKQKKDESDSMTYNLEEGPLSYTVSENETNISSHNLFLPSGSLKDSSSTEKNNCVSSHFANAVLVNQLEDEASKMDHTDSAATSIAAKGNNSMLDINLVPKMLKNSSISISVVTQNNMEILPSDNLLEKLDDNQPWAKHSEINSSDSLGDLSKLGAHTVLEKSVANLPVASDDLVNCNSSIIKSLLVDIVSRVEQKIVEDASVKNCTDFNVPRVISPSNENLSSTPTEYHDVQNSDVTEVKDGATTSETEPFCTDIIIEQDSSNSSRSFECSNHDIQINIDISAETIPNFILHTQNKNLIEVKSDSPRSDRFLEPSDRVDEPMEVIQKKSAGSSNDSIIITGVTTLAGTFGASGGGAFSSISGMCTDVFQSNALAAAVSMNPLTSVHLEEDNRLTTQDTSVIVLSDDSRESDTKRLSSHELIIQKCLLDIIQKINAETMMMNRVSSPLGYSVLSPDLNDDLTTNSSIIEENSQNLPRLQNQVSTFFSKNNENQFGIECSKLSQNMFDNLLGIGDEGEMTEKSKEWQLKPFCLNDDQDLNAMDKGCLTSSDDEGKSSLKQQVTSPKLSLKRNRHGAELSPEREEQHKETEDFQVNGKKIKLKHEVSSPGNTTQVPPSEASARNENRRKFLRFLEYSKTLMDLDASDFEKEKITKRMLQELENTQEWYPSSIIFSSLIDSCWKKLEQDSSETFNVLVEMKREMKKYKRRLKSSVRENSVRRSSISVVKSGGVFPFNFNDSTNSSSQLPSDNPSVPEEKHNTASKLNHVEEKTDFLSNFSLFSNHSPTKNKPPALVNSSIIAPPQEETSPKSSVSGVKLNSELRRNSVNRDAIESEPLSPVPSTSSNVSSVKDIKKSPVKKFPDPDVASSSKQASDDNASSENRQSTAVQDDRNKERIKKLEKMLRDLDKAIKKLQNKELSLDDLDDSTSCYIKEDQYKKRFVKIYKKLCQLQKVPARTGRIVEKKFTYEGSRYKVINSAIQNLINKKKSHEKFPDFSEVLNVVRLVNKTNDVGLTEKAVFMEAERVFKDIGVELQIRRCRDEEELFGCYLTDDFNPAKDPAEHDERLRNTLAENNKKFEASITELIDSYAEIQKAVGDKEDDNEDEEEEEDKEEEEDDKEKADDEMDVEDNLPSTQPSSPALIGKDNNGCSNGEDVVEILDSDRSTDPNEVPEERRAEPPDGQGSLIIRDSLVVEAASSDDDLPALHELIGS